MTEPAQPRTFRSRTGRVLTEAEIERIVEEVESTDFDLTKARIRYPAEPAQSTRNSDARSPLSP